MFTTEGKSEPTKGVRSIVVGATDSSGNKVTDVLASGNEYVIYEVDVKDIQKKLRIFIDGYNDERDAQIVGCYCKVKYQYLEAKGLLYRSDDCRMLQYRVASVLGTALSGYVEMALSQFNQLIDDIRKEYQDKYVRRVMYMLPGYMVLLVLVVVVGMIYWGILQRDNGISFWLIVALASVIGGVLSLTINLPNNKFEVEVTKYMFMAFGAERIAISILSGVIGAIGVKAGVLFPEIFKAEDIWGCMFVVVVAAFSEKLVPNMLARVEQGVQNKK
jgi:hypothetical protein